MSRRRDIRGRPVWTAYKSGTGGEEPDRDLEQHMAHEAFGGWFGRWASRNAIQIID